MLSNYNLHALKKYPRSIIDLYNLQFTFLNNVRHLCVCVCMMGGGGGGLKKSNLKTVWTDSTALPLLVLLIVLAE